MVPFRRNRGTTRSTSRLRATSSHTIGGLSSEKASAMWRNAMGSGVRVRAAMSIEACSYPPSDLMARLTRRATSWSSSASIKSIPLMSSRCSGSIDEGQSSQGTSIAIPGRAKRTRYHWRAKARPSLSVPLLSSSNCANAGPVLSLRHSPEREDGGNQSCNLLWILVPISACGSRRRCTPLTIGEHWARRGVGVVPPSHRR